MSTLPISVLMSVYYRETPAFLRAALTSLVLQTRPASQIVIVFDGPLPAPLEGVVWEFLATLPLKIIPLEENHGLAKALNVGLQHCTEDWVARFDTDDICVPTRFEEQWAFLQANPAVDILGSMIQEFDNDPLAPYAVRAVPETHVAIVSYAKRRSPFNHMTVVYRKRVVLTVGGYPEDHLYEDYALWVKLIQAGFQTANQSRALVLARAGVEMAKRRGGLKYFLSEWNVQKRFLREGFIGLPEFIVNIAIRIPVRLAPSGLRVWFYSNMIRWKPRR